MTRPALNGLLRARSTVQPTPWRLQLRHPRGRATYQQSNATGAPIRDVPTKNHSKLTRSMMKPEAPAKTLPGRAQSEVKSAYWAAAYSVVVSDDMKVMRTIEANA